MPERSFIKFGKGPAGISGKTTNPRTIQIMTKRQLKYREILQNLDKQRSSDKSKMTKIKKENTGRNENDQAYQTKLKNVLITCIHSLQSESHTLTSLCII